MDGDKIRFRIGIGILIFLFGYHVGRKVSQDEFEEMLNYHVANKSQDQKPNVIDITKFTIVE